MKIRMTRLGLILGCLVFSVFSTAELRIEVTKGDDNAVRIAVIPFEWRGRASLPESVAEIITSDLGFSGRFNTLPVTQMLSLPNTAEEVFLRDWKLLDVEYLVMGYLTERGPDLALHFELYNVFEQPTDISELIVGSDLDLRDMAHYASDTLYETLTGIPGAFSTQIMYITATGENDSREFRLNVADADGRRIVTVLQSREPI